jgi:hypothetical protein
MGPTGRFFLALSVAIVALGSGSLMWPRLSDKPRPKVLQDIHDLVLKTSVGQNAANVLGVSDESNVQKLDFGVMASTAVTNTKTAVQNRVRTVVVTNAVNQLNRQFDNLSEDQKTYVRQAICEPQEPTP